ncbi:RNA helicase [Paenibacillus glycanilyticus]|uniref:RNA helicase n=1 Tax=Paenibacillus glycanilyticus TaxID=126569 RepID=UPI001910B468|nr:RNA helicase [Paenibacillus glycanilyticus]
MNKLIYFVDKGFNEYEPLMEYPASSVGIDEMYARQLCTYLIANGVQYELTSNEMQENEEMLIVKRIGPNENYGDESNYRGRGIYIEFRKPNDRGRKLTEIGSANHYEVIRYLLKDIVDVPGYGPMFTTSTEIDEDRGCYVIYVRGMNEPED